MHHHLHIYCCGLLNQTINKNIVVMYSKNELSDQFELHLLIMFAKLYCLKFLWRGDFFLYILKDLFSETEK